VKVGGNLVTTSDQTKTKIHVLSCGLVIGAAASVFPACGNILTDATTYSFSTTQYGSIFVTQTLLAIASSLLSSGLQRKLANSGLLRLSLLCSALAMALLAVIALTPGKPFLSYIVTLTANVCMGIGIGGGISIANVLATAAWPDRPTRGVAALHTMLGCGLATAPLGLSVSVALGLWWLMPIAVAVCAMYLLLGVSGQRTPEVSATPQEYRESHSITKPILLLGALAFLYGVSEATFSNWCVIYLHEFASVSVAAAGLVLSAFWGAIMAGRFYFAAAKPSVGQIIAVWSPLLTAAAYILISQASVPAAQIGGYIVAGLSCAAVYPFLLGRASLLSASRSQFVSGVMVATVLAGTGGGTYLTSLLNRFVGLSLSDIYLFAAVVPLAIFVTLRFYSNRIPFSTSAGTLPPRP
jgi:fucose permease